MSGEKIIQFPRHKHLTSGELRVLRQMQELDAPTEIDPEADFGELVREEGAGWWVGADEISGRIANGLLKKVLVSQSGGGLGDRVVRYVINDEGKAALKDPNYEPEIFKLRPQR